MAEHASDHHAVTDGHDAHGVDSFGNPPEQPSDWGWHHDFGKAARIGGWITFIALILMASPSVTHYNGAGSVALYIFAGLVFIGLAWDIHRRRTAWRD